MVQMAVGTQWNVEQIVPMIPFLGAPAALAAAEAVLAGLFFLAGLRPLDLDLDGVAFLAVLSSAMERFLTSLALMVKMVPSSYCTSYSLSSSRTKFTLALK